MSDWRAAQEYRREHGISLDGYTAGEAYDAGWTAAHRTTPTVTFASEVYIKWLEHGRPRFAPICRKCDWIGPPTNTKQVAYDEGVEHTCGTAPCPDCGHARHTGSCFATDGPTCGCFVKPDVDLVEPDPCPDCSGDGIADGYQWGSGEPEPPCPSCGGRGTKMEPQPGRTFEERPCPDCKGEPHHPANDEHTCPSCGGSGLKRVTVLGVEEAGRVPCPDCDGGRQRSRKVRSDGSELVTNVRCRSCGGSGTAPTDLRSNACDISRHGWCASKECGCHCHGTASAATDERIDAFVDAYFTAPGSDPREPGSGLLTEEGVRRGLAAALEAAVLSRPCRCRCIHEVRAVEAAARARQENDDE